MNAKKLKKEIIHSLLQMVPSPVRQPLIRSMLKVDYSLPEGFEVKIADSKDELEQAFNLVHKAYHDKGLVKSDGKKDLWVTKYHLLPSTAVVVIKNKNKVIATASHIIDSSFGLPVESQWEINHLKVAGSRVAEISALAIDKEYRNSGALFHLTRFMYHYASSLKIDRWVMVVHPKAAIYYKSLFGFQELGGKPQNYAAVSGAKGLAMFAGISQMKHRFSKNYKYTRGEVRFKNFYLQKDFFKRYEHLVPSKIFFKDYRNQLCPEVLEYFFKDRTDILSDLTLRGRAALETHYPASNFGFDKKYENVEFLYPRANKRFPVNCPVTTYQNRGSHSRLTGAVSDLSLTGCKITNINSKSFTISDKVVALIKIGANKTIEVPSKVVWVSSDNEIGLSFDSNPCVSLLEYLGLYDPTKVREEYAAQFKENNLSQNDQAS